MLEAMKAAQEALKAAEQEDVDFTDADLNDPELLAEMARLEKGDMRESTHQPSSSSHPKTTSAMDLDTAPVGTPHEEKVFRTTELSSASRASPSHASSSSSMDVTSHLDEASAYEESIKSLLNQRLREYLEAALKAKELGLPQARNLALTHAKLKELKKRVEEEGEVIDEEEIPSAPLPLPSSPVGPNSSEPSSNPTSKPSPSENIRSPSASPSTPLTPSSTSPSPSRSPSIPSDVQQQQQFQRSQFTPTPPAQLTAEELREKKFAQLEGVLVSQLDEMKKSALEANASNRKAEAMAIVNKRKSVLKDLELIRFARSVPGTPPPAFHIDIIEEVKEMVNEDLSVHEIEVGVVKLEGLKPPSVSDKVLECYVQVECPFPDVNKPTMSLTPTVNDSLDPIFKFAQRIRIERTKALARTFQKKKIVFTIYKPKTWFLGSARLLGKAEMKLGSLCEASEVHEALDVLDVAGHKLIGGKLHAFARLRTPLLKKQVTKETHKVLVIDKHFIGETTAIPPTVSPSSQHTIPNPSRPTDTQGEANQTIHSEQALQSPPNASNPVDYHTQVSPMNPDLTASTVASLHGVRPSEGATSSSSSLADSTFSPSPPTPLTPLTLASDLIDFNSDAKPMITATSKNTPTTGSGDPFVSPPNTSPSPISTAVGSNQMDTTSQFGEMPVVKPSGGLASTANSASSLSSSSNQSPLNDPEHFDWNTAKWMISHSVLGWRKERLEAEIATAKSKKLPQEEIDALEAKKDDVEHKITILIVLVQSGQLTEEEYIRRVRVKIGEEEELATRLASINRPAEVALCKKRIQIMKEEIGLA